MRTKFFLIVLFAAMLIIIGCGKSEEQEEMRQGETEKVESPLVRNPDVDLTIIDENKDGKVFQCPMDWEVISDDAGNCPLCNMKLRESSVEEAQKNLEKLSD
jgi:major membrane immunogen (membrane-anchored lipoprotein)